MGLVSNRGLLTRTSDRRTRIGSIAAKEVQAVVTLDDTPVESEGSVGQSEGGDKDSQHDCGRVGKSMKLKVLLRFDDGIDKLQCLFPGGW